MRQAVAGIRKVHLIFKTHLDVGYTDFARQVVKLYFSEYIPQALQIARELRLAGSPEHFTWTTGSWLIYQYLEQASPTERARMEEAIRAGDISWHGLPFTTHSELLDPGLFRHGLSLSRLLDVRFGRHTIAAKMTDVPGHTRGILPLMAEAGIQFLHIGVNSASTPPAVPPVFVWRDPCGAEVIVMYHKGSYGELMTVPGLDEAIVFAHTGDNLGPQSTEQIQEVFAEMRRDFPGAEICSSTLDAFARQLIKVKAQLPVITAEIGDTWIHGAGTDPKKISQYRALLRLRRKWLESGIIGPEDSHIFAFSQSLLLVPEHTNGLDIKVHLADFETWDKKAFQAARSQENFTTIEASWQEQRSYLDQALQGLEDTSLAVQARNLLAELEPRYPELTGYQRLDQLSAPLSPVHFDVGFDRNTGAITRLVERRTGRIWASPDHPLGLFLYEVFSAADVDRFLRQYIKHRQRTWYWAYPDFGKPGMETVDPGHREWTPLLTSLYCRAENSEPEGSQKKGMRFLALLEMPPEACFGHGAPRQVTLEVFFPDSEPKIDFDLQWFGKDANRLPEALWFSLCPKVRKASGWRMEKVGQWISPLEVIFDGARKLHAVGSGVSYRDDHTSLLIESLDAPLVAPGQRSLLNFNNRQPPLNRGLHFNLYNNIWGTNFPMWYEEDARFRFVVRFRV